MARGCWDVAGRQRRSLMVVAGAVLAVAVTQSAVAASVGQDSRTEYRKTVFIPGAAIHGANGLAVDGRGRLLVASVFGGEILALNRHDGRIVQRLGRDVGIDGPDDVVIGRDGSIYWTELWQGEIGRLAPNGSVTKQFVAPGMNPIAFSPDGRLFAGQAFSGDGLYELDPQLRRPPRVVIPSSGAAPFPRQLNAFAFGPDGMLYAPQPFLGRIVRIDPTSGASASVTGALAGRPPFSVRFDSHGRLYTGLSDGAVVRVNRSTGAVHQIAAIPAGLDNMVFGPGDRLYVSSYENGAVYTVGSRGRLQTLSRGGLILPGGITAMEDEAAGDSLFVADPWKLARFDARTGELRQLDRYSFTSNGIIAPSTVAPDGRRLVITSWMAGAPIQLWDPLARVPAGSVTDNNVPLNAIRFGRDLVVAELATGSVTRWDQHGTRSVIARGLLVPAGLAATDDDLWVADRATGIVWKLVDGGRVLRSPLVTARRLHAPEGLAVDHDGSLLVIETGTERLSRIDAKTGQVTTVAKNLKLGLRGSVTGTPTFALSSVAVGRPPTIFVTADIANLVYRLRPVHRPPGPRLLSARRTPAAR